LAAVRQDGWALEWAAVKLQKDPEILLVASSRRCFDDDDRRVVVLILLLREETVMIRTRWCVVSIKEKQDFLLLMPP